MLQDQMTIVESTGHLSDVTKPNTKSDINMPWSFEVFKLPVDIVAFDPWPAVQKEREKERDVSQMPHKKGQLWSMGQNSKKVL